MKRKRKGRGKEERKGRGKGLCAVEGDFLNKWVSIGIARSIFIFPLPSTKHCVKLLQTQL